jgi:O-antigen ligase
MRLAQRLIEISIGAVLLIPLVTIPSQVVYPFVVPKVVLFRSLVEVMLGAWLLLVIAQPDRYRLRPTPVNLSVALLLTSAAISTLAGVDAYRSLWDSNERMLGLFTLLHFGAFYAVVTSVVRDRESWNRLLTILLVASAGVMWVAILQRFGLGILESRGPRSDSTLGHPGYVGGLGAFMVPLALLIAVRESSSARRWLAATCAALGIAGIIVSESRSAMIALCVGLATLAVCYGISLPRGTRPRRAIFVALLGIAVTGGVGLVLRDRIALEDVPGLRRFAGLSVAEGTARTRILAWNVALKAARERPLLGWGPGNYYYAFDRFHPPEMLEHGLEETWFDNAHNTLLNALAVQGAPGFALQLALFATPCFLLWRGFRQGRIDRYLACVGTSLLVTHLVGNLFSFENVTSYLCLFLLLAFLNVELATERESVAARSKPLSPILAAAAAAAVLLAIWLANVETAIASRAAHRAVIAANEGRPAIALVAFEQSAARLSPHVDGVRNLVAETILDRFDAYVAAGRSEEAVQLAARMYAELERNAKLHPLDVRVHIRRGNLALKLATSDGGRARLEHMESELQDALGRAPRRQEIRFVLSSIKAGLGKPREAIELLRESIEAAPTSGEGWWRLAFVYELYGMTADAARTLEDAQRAGARIGPEGASALDSIRR